MEPSFWSWEKVTSGIPAGRHGGGRNGAQLLELGKAQHRSPVVAAAQAVAMEPSFWSWEKPEKVLKPKDHLSSRNGAQLLELGKAGPGRYPYYCKIVPSQWSPAFGAGKRLRELQR